MSDMEMASVRKPSNNDLEALSPWSEIGVHLQRI